MEADEFREVLIEKEIVKGSFIATRTSNSVCIGYFLEACLRTSQGGFINLSGTRKIGQGRQEKDWFDHTYSIPISMILDLRLIDPPFEEYRVDEKAQRKLDD